jgi:RNA polymerase sigma-70 factor (ECF subfamily)
MRPLVAAKLVGTLPAVTTETIWSQLQGDLHGFIRRRVDSDATADDLLQDVFLRIHERLGQLTDEERVGPWVYRIARNRVIDHYRSQKPSAPLPDNLSDDAEIDQTELNQMIGAWLRATIEQLPESQRDAIRMVELEGKTQREVADALGLSLSGAKSRVQRGRAELRRMLDRCCAIERDRRGNVLSVEQRNPCC